MKQGQIKFKCWDIWNKKWVQQSNIAILPNGKVGFFINSEHRDSLDPHFMEKENWIPLFYTGETDMKGKEIYNGHIVVMHFLGIDFISEVYFKSGQFGVDRGGKKGNFYPLTGWSGQWEIIGHALENPEILEKQMQPQ